MSSVPHHDSEQPVQGVIIERCKPGLRITRSWSKIAGVVMLLWVALWLGLTHFLTSLSPTTEPGDRLLLIPALLMGYCALTRFVNRTVIEISAKGVVVRHQPLPWWGNRRLAVQDVQALQTGVKRIYAKGHTVHEYRIFVIRAHGRKTMLLKGIELTLAQMDCIVTAIADYLQVPLV